MTGATTSLANSAVVVRRASCSSLSLKLITAAMVPGGCCGSARLCTVHRLGHSLPDKEGVCRDGDADLPRLLCARRPQRSDLLHLRRQPATPGKRLGRGA